jgi:hypothetical protein
MLNDIIYKSSKVMKKHDYSIMFILVFLLIIGFIYCTSLYNKSVVLDTPKQEVNYTVNETVILEKLKEVVVFKDYSSKIEEPIHYVKVEVKEIQQTKATPTTIYKLVSNHKVKHTKHIMLAKVHKTKHYSKVYLAKLDHKHTSKIQLAKVDTSKHKIKLKQIENTYYTVKVKPYKEFTVRSLPKTYIT